MKPISRSACLPACQFINVCLCLFIFFSAPEPNITVNTTPPVLIPCDTPYTYKVYKHSLWDCMALENTKTNVVDVYKWLETETGSMNRTSWQVSLADFDQQSQYEGFTLIGWVRDSEYLKVCCMSISCATWLILGYSVSDNLPGLLYNACTDTQLNSTIGVIPSVADWDLAH